MRRLWLLLVACGWAAAAAAWAACAHARREAAHWQGRARAAEARVGAACLPVYGLWWVDRRCDGLVLGLLPTAAQALVCPARLQVYRSIDQADVRARAQALGAGATPQPLVLEERGVRERVITLRWRAEIE